MKKKLITGIVVVALACFGFAALAGCGGGQSSNQSSDKSNDSKTTLIVGFISIPRSNRSCVIVRLKYVALYMKCLRCSHHQTRS